MSKSIAVIFVKSCAAALTVSMSLFFAACGGGSGGSVDAAGQLAAHPPLPPGRLMVADNGLTGKELYVSVNGSATLLKDINSDTSSNPTNAVSIGNMVYFIANDGVTGFELWKADTNGADGAVRVKDINPGSPGAFANNIVWSTQAIAVINDVLYFVADDGVHGWELWRSDGTPDGTVLVADINPNGNAFYEAQIIVPVVNGSVFYFAADDGTHGRELWRSDGTRAGTRMVKDIYPNGDSSNPQNLTIVNNTLFFSAYERNHGEELWQSDGTESGTTMVLDIYPDSGNSSPSHFLSMNNVLYFFANDGARGYELWKTDGIPGGTALVKDINPGGANSVESYWTQISAVIDNQLLFIAYDGVRGVELWKTDGTGSGTQIVRDINPNGASGLREYSQVYRLNDGKLYFMANDDTHGWELWRSDGTSDGTTMVRDIFPGTESSAIFAFTVLNKKLYFVANDGVSGHELWTSDGTTNGTRLLKDINPGLPDGELGEITRAGDNLYFSATDGRGSQLWKSDGSAAGTALVKGISPITNMLGKLTAVGNRIVFRASDGVRGIELWRSDGSTDGTAILADINTMMTDDANPTGFFKVRGVTYFAASSYTTNSSEKRELWRTDGSAEGTYRVHSVFPYNTDEGGVVELGDYFYFAASDAAHGTELWRSDGTGNGTMLVKDINPGPGEGYSGYASKLFLLGDTLYFVAYDVEHGYEWWRSDGTELGTVLVKDINPGSASGSSYSHYNNGINILGDKFYFSANDGTHGNEIWMSNGTDAGTRMLMDIVPGLRDGIATYCSVCVTGMADWIYFQDSQGNMWISDGGAAGTRKFSDMVTDFSNVRNVIKKDANIAYVIASDNAHGQELWITNGTAQGTTLVKDITPGVRGSVLANFNIVEGTLYFTKEDSVNGLELWKSDGTEFGTAKVKTLLASEGNGSVPGASLEFNKQGRFFELYTSGGGTSLWGTDGTAAGTVKLASGSSVLESDAIFTDGKLFYAYSPNEDLGIQEIWMSDGTLAGTRLIRTFASGTQSTDIVFNLVYGNVVYFTVDDGTHGTELWGSDGTMAGTGLVVDLNPGRAGSNLEIISH